MRTATESRACDTTPCTSSGAHRPPSSLWCRLAMSRSRVLTALGRGQDPGADRGERAARSGHEQLALLSACNVNRGVFNRQARTRTASAQEPPQPSAVPHAQPGTPQIGPSAHFVEAQAASQCPSRAGGERLWNAAARVTLRCASMRDSTSGCCGLRSTHSFHLSDRSTRRRTVCARQIDLLARIPLDVKQTRWWVARVAQPTPPLRTRRHPGPVRLSPAVVLRVDGDGGGEQLGRAVHHHFCRQHQQPRRLLGLAGEPRPHIHAVNAGVGVGPVEISRRVRRVIPSWWGRAVVLRIDASHDNERAVPCPQQPETHICKASGAPLRTHSPRRGLRHRWPSRAAQAGRRHHSQRPGPSFRLPSSCASGLEAAS